MPSIQRDRHRESSSIEPLDPLQSEADWKVQLKREVAGLSADEQEERLTPAKPILTHSEPVQRKPADAVQREPTGTGEEKPKILKNPLFVGDALLQDVLNGKTKISSGKGDHIEKVQQGLMNLEFDLPRYGADGDYGGETRRAMSRFEKGAGLGVNGILDQESMDLLDRVAPAQPLQPRTLSNSMFAGDAFLQQVADGKRRITSGKGDHIKKVQQALINLGFNLPIYGADGGFGSECKKALEQFQSANNLYPSQAVDRGTIYQLDQVATSSPVTKYLRYDELFKDGLLDATIGVGYDEENGFDYEIDQIRGDLKSRLDLEPCDDAKAKELYEKAGMQMPSKGDGEYYVKEGALSWKGTPVNVLVRLFTYQDPQAKQAFLEAMQNSDVAIYTGHGRYGSGPDFDHKTKGAGNIWINPNPTVKDSGTRGMYEKLEHGGAKKNELQTISFDKKYKVWFFDGCNTIHYSPAIRKNKTLKPEQLDVFGWGTEVGYDTTNIDVITFIEGLIKQQSAQQIIQALNAANRVTNPQKGLQAEGLGDNPSTK